MKWILLLLFLTISLVRAEGPDQEYIRIYKVISQGDALKENGESRAALQRYRDAETALKKLQSVYPQWNEGVVKYRLAYLAENLANQPQPTSPNQASREETKISSTPEKMFEEVRRLQAEKAALEAKLKEALSAQPIAVTSELSKAEAKLVALEKECDLLKVALEQEQKTVAPIVVPVKNPAVSPSAKELAQLRARLEVLEARPVPYTAEELALFKKTAPQLAPVEVKPVKKSKELPPGSGTLVAQAERAFTARRLDEAEKKYQEVLRQDEDNVYILGNLAATQLEMNNVAAAEKNVKHALEIDPDDAFSLTLLGMIKVRQDNFDEALDVLSRAAKIDPNNPETQNYLGISLSQKGQREAAEAALRKAIKMQPNYAGAHHNLAVIYATQKPPFLELARWHYEKAIALGHAKNSDLEKMLGAQK